MKYFVMILMLPVLLALPCHAAVAVIGTGESLRFDPAAISPKMHAGYELFVEKCTKCHSQHRVVVALTTGVSPISNQLFDLDSLRVTVYGMVKRANIRPATAISKDDAKTIVNFLRTTLQHAAR